MRPPASTFALALAVTLTTGCAPEGAGEAETPLQGLSFGATQPRYPASWSGEEWAIDVDFSFTNTSGTSLYLPACPDARSPALERWEDGAWVPAYTPPAAECGEPPAAIAAESTWTDTLRVRAGVPADGAAPQLAPGRVEGSYRLVWSVLRSGEPGGEEERLTSASFRVGGQPPAANPASGPTAWR